MLKPLRGSGGQSVFVVGSEKASNLNQMIEAISRDGYVIAQAYVPAAKDGDIRFFLMNGVPLMHKGKYAAFRRTSASDDVRSNIHAGGSASKAEIGETELMVAELVRPKLVARRHVPRGPGHRRRQDPGDQRLQPGRAAQLQQVRRRALFHGDHRGDRAQGGNPQGIPAASFTNRELADPLNPGAVLSMR